MSAIKRFFERRKTQLKFKKAGTGHKLTESTSSSSSGVNQPSQSVSREPKAPQSEVANKAAVAALARFQQNEQTSAENVMAGHSLSSIRAKARKELENEKATQYGTGVTSNIISTGSHLKELKLDSAPVLSVNGVFFHCPLIGKEVLRRPEIEEKIKLFLYNQLNEEHALTACLIIHTCNKSVTKVNACIETLKKYFDNILTHPDEEKYRKIRVNNRIFQEKVFPLEGTADFLMASGFEKKMLPNTEGAEEEFWVFTPDCPDFLVELKENLDAAEPILPELDRNLQVFKFNEVTAKVNLPSEFHNVTKEELKREQELRTQQVQLDTQLRTKAMREKGELLEKRRYRYTLIRVRFPDDYVLQGTFKTSETLEDLLSYIRENLSNDWLPFNLRTSTGQLINDTELMKTSFLDLHLVPAAIIHADFETSMIDEIKRETGQTDFMYLSYQCMELVQER